MTIFRTIEGYGTEITLTDKELRQAASELELIDYIEHVKIMWQTNTGAEFPHDDSLARQIAQRALQILDKNDAYWDAFWDTIKSAIDEFNDDINVIEI